MEKLQISCYYSLRFVWIFGTQVETTTGNHGKEGLMGILIRL